MLKVHLIRHGMTEGNLRKAYIGSTEEELCESGIKDLIHKKENGCYKKAGQLFSSPMIRCRQTASILFSDQEMQIVEGMRECDFGSFENKNYSELSGNPLYQLWIESDGKLAFPNGESRESFQNRCVSSFIETVENMEKVKRMEVAIKIKAGKQAKITEQLETPDAVFIVHGGTIMSIMSAICTEERDFYDWIIGNGEGYCCYYENHRIILGKRIGICGNIISLH